MLKNCKLLLLVISGIFGLTISSSYGSTPQDDLLSRVTLEIARIEVSVMSGDQLDALTQYIVECKPYPSNERDARCARAYTTLDIKASNAKHLDALRMALYVLDKTQPWSKASPSSMDTRLIDRRREIFTELEESASKRYEVLRKANSE